MKLHEYLKAVSMVFYGYHQTTKFWVSVSEKVFMGGCR